MAVAWALVALRSRLAAVAAGAPAVAAPNADARARRRDAASPMRLISCLVRAICASRARSYAESPSPSIIKIFIGP